MTRRLRNRWLAVVAIWGAVLAVTGWNIRLVNQIQSRRQDLETTQMDLRFLRANQSTIQAVRLQKARMNHTVKSAGMGFLVVENNLKRLSWDLGLQQLRVETEKNQQVSNTMPISIVAVGTVPAVVQWMTAVEDRYPYLAIERLEMAYDPDTHSGRLQAIFNYHFIITDMEQVG